MATKQQKDLLNFLGAKLSADGKKVVITLISGKGDKKEYFTACIKLNNQQKTHAKIDEDGVYVLVKIPMLQEREEIDENEELPF